MATFVRIFLGGLCALFALAVPLASASAGPQGRSEEVFAVQWSAPLEVGAAVLTGGEFVVATEGCRASLAAFGAGGVVIADGAGVVRRLDGKGDPIDEFDVGTRPRALAVSGNGTRGAERLATHRRPFSYGQAAYLGRTKTVAVAGFTGPIVFRSGVEQPAQLPLDMPTPKVLAASQDGTKLCFASAEAAACLPVSEQPTAAVEAGDDAIVTTPAPSGPPDLSSAGGGNTFVVNADQVVGVAAVLALYGLSPLVLSGTHTDVEYSEALAITAAGSIGVLAFGAGVGIGVMGYLIADMALDAMRSAEQIPIIGPIVLIPVALVFGAVGVSAMAIGAVLALGSPAVTAFAMTRTDNAFGLDVANPWGVSVAAASGMLLGFAGGGILGASLELDLGVTLSIATGMSLVTTTAGYALLREGRPRQPVMVVSPILVF